MKSMCLGAIVILTFIVSLRIFQVNANTNYRWVTILKPTLSSVDTDMRSPWTKAYLIKNRYR